MNGDRPNHLAWPHGEPFPGLPQRSSEGNNGGPPVRDRRRSRALGQDIVNNMMGQICAWDDPTAEDAETLIAFLKAYDFAEAAVANIDISNPNIDPFTGVASTVIPPGLVQSLEVLAVLQWGHDGVSKQVVLNLPAGQVIKVPMAGSYARASSKLTCKYFARTVVAPIAPSNATLVYLNADANVRNNIFNNAQSPLLSPAVGYSANLPTTPIHVDGIIAKGTAAFSQGGSSDRGARACRRFYGSVPVQAAGYPAGGALVFCPIAFGASAVMLATNPSNFTSIDGNARVLSPLMFAMLDHAGNVVGQQPANQFVPLIANCQSIAVYNTAANGGENPFTLIYDLGL